MTIVSSMKKMLRPIYLKYLRPIRVKLTGNVRRINRSRVNIQIMRNIHEGKRCFIVGNGPSLIPEDVNKLENEIWFAANRIYQIFDKTNCRPTYYCIEDHNVLREIYKEISKQIGCEMFIGIGEICKVPKIKDAIYVEILDSNYYPNCPNFSDNISRGICQGNTVTYMSIQIAAYMGFKEIYLLGVDHNYSYNLNPDGSITYNEGVKDYFSSDGKIAGPPQIQKMTLAYQAAKKYADEHGIKIYNATRGGKLEVFERVDFDSLF